MANEHVVLERVQELTWALLDEQITDDEFALLDNLLLSDDAARKRYVECVQLHVDLVNHYATEKAAAESQTAKLPPVLSFLDTGTPLGFDSPAEDATP